MGFVRPAVCVLILAAVGCGQQVLSPDDAPTPPSKPAASPSSLASAPIPSPSPTPTPSPSPTPTPAPYWQRVERNGEIEGYGYVPDFVDMQATWSDLIARVRLLSVEPSYRIFSSTAPERRYLPYVHFSFGIIETLWGNPLGDVVVVEYRVYGGEPTEAQAIEQAKKWIASERDAWWNKQEAIIFLDDLRFVPQDYAPEIATGAHYRFADHFSCGDNSSCGTWYIGANDSYPSWVWLPFVGQDASLEVPDSERMFHVVVVPYRAIDYELQIAPASLANIKAILEPHWSKDWVRGIYLDKHRNLWESKGSDSYSFVSSFGDEDGRLLSTEKIVVRNGEVVEVFSTEDGDQWVKVWPDGSRPNAVPSAKTLERSSFIWDDIWQRIIRENWPINDVSFDYEFGYPTALRFFRLKDEPDVFLYISEYTPLEN